MIEIVFDTPNNFTRSDKVPASEIIGLMSGWDFDLKDNIIVNVAKDNVSPVDGQTNEILDVTDSFGNIYTKTAEYCLGRNKAGSGVVVAQFCARNTVVAPNTTVLQITAHFSSSAKAKAIAGSVLKSDQPLEVVAVDVRTDINSDAGPMDLVVPDAEHLWVRSMGKEGVHGSLTTTIWGWDWAAVGTNGSPTASNISVGTELAVVMGPSNPSNPIWLFGGDHVSIYAAYKEVV